MAAHTSGRLIVIAILAGVVIIGLLWLPVLGDRLNAFLSKRAPPVALRVFFLGLAILVTGLVVKVRVLEVVGACLIGALIIAAIIDNY